MQLPKLHTTVRFRSPAPSAKRTGTDPVRDGLVERLNRPGENVTGVVFFAADLGAKRLEILRQILPPGNAVGMLVNPGSPNTEGERRDAQAAAKAMGQKLVTFDVAADNDLEPAFAAMVRHGISGLLVGTGAFLHSQRERVTALAARHAFAAIYVEREFVKAGGLMSYGASITEAYRQVGVYAARILRGERAGDLPVIQSTKVELVLNMRTARDLNLHIPPALSLRADEIME